VLLLQNGLDAAEVAARYFPAPRLLSGVVELGATSLTPGDVTYAIRGRLLVAAPGGASDLAAAAAALLRPALPVAVSADIRGAQRLKLVINLNNGATAATGLTVQQLYARPAGVRLSLQLMGEGLACFDAAGLPLERSPRSRLLRALLGLPDRVAIAAFRLQGRRMLRAAPVYGSTLQSILRGRPTEVHALNGAVVRLGQRHGVATPVNRAVVAAVERAERAAAAGDRPAFVAPGYLTPVPSVSRLRLIVSLRSTAPRPPKGGPSAAVGVGA
jgi:2-dehydropantoate 2-reductase